jgi:large subunit ribosomal protein L7/L12
VEVLSDLTIKEVAQLVKLLEAEWGVSASAPVLATAPVAEGANGGSEKSSFNVVLQAAGQSKIAVIKVIREITGLGLAEAKAIVDGAPKEVKAGVEKKVAEEIKKKLEEAGASVELK